MRLAPAARRRVLANLAPGVTEIERTTVRISVMSAEMRAPVVLAEHVDGIAEMTSVSTHWSRLKRRCGRSRRERVCGLRRRCGPIPNGSSCRFQAIAPDAKPVGSATVISAFVLIKAAPQRVADLASELTEVDGVAEVYSVTGDHDLIVVVRVREHDNLAEIVTGHISGRPGHRRDPHAGRLQGHSRHDLESMWSLGAG